MLGSNLRPKEAEAVHAGAQNLARRESGSYKVRIKSVCPHWATQKMGSTHGV
jgi:hypothetical protein